MGYFPIFQRYFHVILLEIVQDESSNEPHFLVIANPVSGLLYLKVLVVEL